MGLTPEQQKFFDDLEEMFAMPAWKALVEEAKRTIYHLQAEALEAGSFEEVCIKRGRAQQLAEFINMEEMMELQKAEVVRQDLEQDVYAAL
jgi:hypothetical protein